MEMYDRLWIFFTLLMLISTLLGGDVLWNNAAANVGNVFLIEALTGNSQDMLSLAEQWLICPLDQVRSGSCRSLGQIYLAKGQFRKASEFFEMAISLDPSDLISRFLLGQALAFDGKEDLAFEQWRLARASNYFVSVGKESENIGKLEDAENAYKRALAIDPESARAAFALAHLYETMKEWNRAIAMYQYTVALQPDDGAVYYALGNLWEQHKQSPEVAIDVFKQGIARAPRYVWNYIALGRIFARLGNTDEVEFWFCEAERVEPNSSMPQFSLGLYFLGQRQAAPAIEHFRSALDKDADNPSIHFHLGKAYALDGLIDLAIIEYQKTIRLAPDYVWGYIALGDLYAKRGQVQNAVVSYCKLLCRDPNNNVPRNRLLSLQGEQGFSCSCTE